MTINIEDTEKRHDNLMRAFTDSDFRKELEEVCTSIKNEINEWLDKLPRFDSRIENVFHLQARVKGEKNFEEKLYRKDYIRVWNVSDNVNDNKSLIRKELTDLIGIRVNCYFVENEEKLYRYFELHSKELENFTFYFDENKEQKNSHTIYKFSGIYQDSYRFEIQIKSIVHNVWGEVDHKVIYKNPTYDGFIDKKKEISDSLYNVLFASDRQLCSIFKMQESEEQLIKSLFFCYTKGSVIDLCKTDILADHYENYFRAFSDISSIRKYVVSRMAGQDYQKIDVPPVDGEKYMPLKSVVDKLFPQFYLICLMHIDNCIHRHKNYDAFVYYFLDCVVGDYVKNADDTEFEGSFDENENNEEPQTPIFDLLVVINSTLGMCVKENRIKEMIQNG